MELAGLEPATSWVRSRSAASPNPLQKRVSGHFAGAKPLGYPAVALGFWGWGALHPQKGGAPRATAGGDTPSVWDPLSSSLASRQAPARAGVRDSHPPARQERPRCRVRVPLLLARKAEVVRSPPAGNPAASRCARRRGSQSSSAGAAILSGSPNARSSPCRSRSASSARARRFSSAHRSLAAPSRSRSHARSCPPRPSLRRSLSPDQVPGASSGCS
jgi:hypothetical protein